MREVRWERMFIDELETAFAACPLVYFTYGLCEPHGPQNAIGLDELKAHAVACTAAREHGGIVAPADFWHIHELGGYALWGRQTIGEVPRKWLTAVPPWVHFKNICYQLRAAEAIGFHAAILLTGHYGPNWHDLKKLMELIQPRLAMRVYSLPDFEANQPGFSGKGDGGDHAGRVETSLLWALEPQCTDVSRIPPAGTPGCHWAMGGNAAESDRRIGERMVADEVRLLAAKAQELLAAYRQPPVGPRLVTFEEVEAFWAECVVPALKTFYSMQPWWGAEDHVPEASVWHANWPIPNRC